MPHVGLQYPPFGGSVLAVVFKHELLEPQQAVMRSLPFLAGAVITDEALGDGLIHDVVRHCMEYDLVDKGRSLHEPFLRLVDKEHLELAGLIGLGVQDVG